MNKINNLKLSTLSLLLLSSAAFADGLSDLNKALELLKGQDSVSAVLESTYVENRGKKKKLKTTNGYVQVLLTDSVEGLQITYSSDTLKNIENEVNAKQSDEETDTPTLNAVDGIEATELRNMLSASSSITRMLKKATFLNEQSIESNNQTVRVVNFSLPLEAIVDDKEVRGYVDDFSGEYSITIDEFGTPLSTKLSFEGDGRAFVIFTLEVAQTITSNYQVIGNRLVTIRKSFERSQSSTWGESDSTGYKELTIQSNEELVALQ